MRKIIFLMLFSVHCWAQSDGFAMRNKNLVWENVIISSETNIPGLIERHPRLKITSSNKSVYKGTGSHVKNTCPGVSAFMENELSFNFEIELGDGKYRVTVSDLVYHTGKSKATAEKLLLEKGGLKQDATTKTDLDCLGAYFNRIFAMTMVYKNKM